MSEPGRPKTIEEYAALQMALARGPREAVLRAHGIDEDILSEIDKEFDDAMSKAMDEESEGVPALLAAYDEGLRKARRENGDVAKSEEILSLQEFARLTSALESGKDSTQAFAARGVTFERYVRASEHWAPKLATDLDLAQEFMALRRR